MDAPVVARLTVAQLIGSQSTGNIARGYALPTTAFRTVRRSAP
ncbi:hypothetical protein [Streptomyces sp. NPDC016845]